MSNDTKVAIPLDTRMHPIYRAMGSPIASVANFKLGSELVPVDVFNLSLDKYKTRGFLGISCLNPTSNNNIIITLGAPFASDRDIVIAPSQFMTLDWQTFGPAILDDTKGIFTTRVRARLENVQDGVYALATIGYGGSGQPTDQMNIDINGKIYEFSDDESKDPVNNVIVPIGVDADASYTNLVAAVLANEQAVTPSIDTGADVVTITSNYGGDFGDGLVVADGLTPTGAAFSGPTAGGTGGAPATFHIW